VQQEGNQYNAAGNEVAQLLAASEMAAVAIYTGQPNEAVVPAASPHVVVIEKGQGVDKVIEWLKEQSAIIFHIQTAAQAIRKDLEAVFHASIWPRWKYWIDEGSKVTLLDSAITRHLVSHLYAGLLELDAGTVHPEEWYFVPPITTRNISTGDLIKSAEGVVEIVVTPRCDLAHDDKSSTIQLAECEDIATQWTALHADLTCANKKKEEAAKNKIKSWYQHRNRFVLHFLPPMITDKGAKAGPWAVRFDRIRSIPKSENAAKDLHAQRFASVTSEFLPSLVSRLGTFFNRIGAPDLS
jgi:hypothetical protein